MDIDSAGLGRRLLTLSDSFWAGWKTGVQGQTDKEITAWTEKDWRREIEFVLRSAETLVDNTQWFLQQMLEEGPHVDLELMEGWQEAALRDIRQARRLIESKL